jgi:hypothetical protein
MKSFQARTLDVETGNAAVFYQPLADLLSGSGVR